MTVTYDRGQFERAHARLRADPAALTLGNIERLATFSPDLGREGVAARQAALFPAAPAILAPAQAPATKSGLSAQSIEKIAEATVAFVKQQLAPILTRLDAFEQQPPSPHYAGTFEQGKSYTRGSLATKAGGLWLALQTTTQVPGRSDQWKLIVKSGEALR